ncbi:origin recognition complex subunit 5-like protein [Neocallimastix lanati (nom. inval.)]|jgi:origin recognition complex subunit 5|uniref:Origin recognition complex subunit 5 n=1 Tax=Neocallimastix californiae TaxID=1754190 RepID=A0A1Y2BQX0_9FUNG|nr:origin recognition complex subunit 5-like protein [Neocallimastix sp. JGI-2020a]ORY37141.1 origin recognition complex subunit 5-like protein [Neocallimastix californiae]|eukprot:ORY37141.1 origin recognition complex subunit 5-like protein [Neocallimastix californiae]
MEIQDEIDEQFELLKINYPGRELQITRLQNLIGDIHQIVPSSIFIFGDSATGKTSIVRAIFSKYKKYASFINCINCYTPRLLFEHCLNKLSGYIPGPDNLYSNYAHCETVSEFVHYLVEICSKDENKDDEVIGRYLVFDNAERLRETNPLLLSALLRVPEITNLNITIILISNIVWEKFRSQTGMLEPILLQFPSYSKNEILNIMIKDCPKDENKNFYYIFIELLYDVFNKPCRNLNELRHMAMLLYPKYIEPINEGNATRNDTVKLFKHIEIYFKQALDKLYLRNISSSEWKNKSLEEYIEPSINSDITFELPYYTKFLLIASYLASYNPPRYDLRFFSKSSENKRRKSRKQEDVSGNKRSQQLYGPKVFPMERMLAIFYSIIEDPIEGTIDINRQIASLLTLKLLIKIGNTDILNQMKCKCNVNYEFIQYLSKSVHFDITKYLYEAI